MKKKQWESMIFNEASVDRDDMEKTLREILAKEMPDCSEDAIQQLIEQQFGAEYWRGGVDGKEEYQVTVYTQGGVFGVGDLNRVREGWPQMTHLSFKRVDKEAMHDWRIFQAIKNAIVGPEYEAVELFPAEDRRVDGANQYHLWVLADKKVRFPFGFNERHVSYDIVGGGKQKAATL